MSELIEQAMHAAREAADALVQERSVDTLKKLQDHFKRFANVPAAGRPLWVATHYAQLLNQAEQAFKACNIFIEKFWIEIAPGLVGVNGDYAEEVAKAQKTQGALRLTVMVISLFDHHQESDFQEQAETVADVFGWLHAVIVDGAMPEMPEKRKQAVQLLTKKRAELSVQELQAELSALAFGSYEKRDVKAPFEKAHTLVGEALAVHGFYLSWVQSDAQSNGPTDVIAHAEATKTSFMMQAIHAIFEMLGNVHLYERNELQAHAHELSMLFKRMGELLTVVSEHLPAAASDSPPTKPTSPTLTDEEAPLGENVVRLGSHKKKRTLH